MADSFRTFVVRLPSQWHADGVNAMRQTPFQLRALGIGTRPVWSGTHERDGARVAVYSVIAERPALDRLRTSLQQSALAEEVEGTGNPLRWAMSGDGWVSTNMLKSPGKGTGAPLLWSSYLPLATGMQRYEELETAIDSSDWEWKA